MPYLMPLTEMEESLAGIAPESAAIVVLSAAEFEALLHLAETRRRDEAKARSPHS
jgi:hypothetical protein